MQFDKYHLYFIIYCIELKLKKSKIALVSNITELISQNFHTVIYLFLECKKL